MFLKYIFRWIPLFAFPMHIWSCLDRIPTYSCDAMLYQCQCQLQQQRHTESNGWFAFFKYQFLSSPSLSFAGSVYAAHICAPTRFNGSEFMHTVYQRCKVIKLYSQKHNQTWLVKLKNEINTNQKLTRVNLFKK